MLKLIVQQNDDSGMKFTINVLRGIPPSVFGLTLAIFRTRRQSVLLLNDVLFLQQKLHTFS